ncbi:MAG TPA: ABC transporter ATP-binding protein [Edaphobacter sp.]|nr:ABC transporter ATP-binding protein [Edaphobacter sp.]
MLKDHKGAAGFLAVLIVTSSLLEVFVPFLTQRLIDLVVMTLRTRRVLTFQTILQFGLFIFVSVAIARILRGVYNYHSFRLMGQIEDEIKTNAFANFLNLDMTWHSRLNSGQVVGTLDRGGTAIFVVLYEILGQSLIPPFVIFANIFVSLLFTNRWIALVIVLPVPLYLLMVGRMVNRLHNYEHETNEKFEAVSKESYDVSSNIATVKKFCQENREAAIQKRLVDRARSSQLRAEWLWAIVENMQSWVATLGRVTVIVFGGYLVLQGRCTVGEYVLFLSFQEMLLQPMTQLSVVVPKLRRNLARTEGLFEVYDAKPIVVDAPDAATLAPLCQSIEFRNLSFKYEASDRWILKNVSFFVPAGATVALIGRSGTGKTTLMNLLLRVYDPQEGSVLIDGVDIKTVTQESLRRQIAVVPQEVDLFSRSIAENVAYGRPNASREEIETAVTAALAHDFIARSDHGYDTVVGERGLRLSGGERQRVGIARAILRNPPLLILDEATSHLDTESERIIQDAAEHLMRDRTCFIIAHRLSTIRDADLVVVFGENGAEDIGNHEELLNRSHTYRKLYDLPDERQLASQSSDWPGHRAELLR